MGCLSNHFYHEITGDVPSHFHKLRTRNAIIPQLEDVNAIYTKRRDYFCTRQKLLRQQDRPCQIMRRGPICLSVPDKLKYKFKINLILIQWYHSYQRINKH